MANLMINIVFVVGGIALGAYIIFFGRRALFATLGIIALATAGNLLAVLFTTVDSGPELIEIGAWGYIGIAVAFGVFGIIIGYYSPNNAAYAIGIIAGAAIAIWLLDVSSYVLVSIANLSEQWIIALVICLAAIGGAAGLWLVRIERDEALIVLAVLVGAELIGDSLDLNSSSSLTAIIFISLALAGLLTQYAEYLRENRKGIESTLGEPTSSSLAILQELNLD